MTPEEINRFIRWLPNDPVEITIKKKLPLKGPYKPKNILPKNQTKNFPKTIGNIFMSFFKKNEKIYTFDENFFFERATDITYMENFEKNFKIEAFWKWVRHRKLKNLPDYRRTFYYLKNKNYIIQHYKHLLKKLFNYFLVNHAYQIIMDKRVNHNIYGEAAEKYIDFIPEFLRNLESEKGFRSLSRKKL